MSKRLFYAIELDSQLRDQLADEQRRLQQLGVTGRFTRPDNLHLTLQFLGEIEEEKLAELKRILQQTASEYKPFTLCFSGLGTFGRKRDILWLGLRKQPELDRLQQILTVNLAAAGFPYETRPYQPHLTLARQARYSNEQIWQEKTSVRCLNVTAVSLMESSQVQGKLRYTALARQALLVEEDMS